jgi:hypothetical protein
MIPAMEKLYPSILRRYLTNNIGRKMQIATDCNIFFISKVFCTFYPDLKELLQNTLKADLAKSQHPSSYQLYFAKA